jgi:hypothetical protein
MASYDVFTPPAVSTKMLTYLPDRVRRLLEPSVGTGDLLRAAEGRYDHADVFDINLTYLAAITEGAQVTKTCGDFLTQDLPQRYDAILMNPPYLRFQSMTASQRAAVRATSEVLRTGNVDLYIAFLVKCIGLLTEDGTLVAITPSTWLYNKSAVQFREWLIHERLIAEIHDYGSEKVFPGIDVYCAILVVRPGPKDAYVRDGVRIPYGVAAPEAPARTLGTTCELQNGIATLCDRVFLHDAPLFNEPCWVPILKVSKQKVRSAIFPYRNGTILPEDEFKRDNPQTYAYLETHRTELANRDRGAKTYDAWYAYGRKQGLHVPAFPTSVYLSTLCASTLPSFQAPTGLFYSGLRVTPREGTCDEIERAIADHREEILRQCSKRSNGWVNLTATVLRQVPR